MRDVSKINGEVTEALAEVLAYKGTALFIAFVKLLDLVAERQLESLADTSPQDTPRTQGALSQARALRRAMTDPGPSRNPIG